MLRADKDSPCNPVAHVQVLYAIKTRSGEVYMRFQKMYGDTSALQVLHCSCVLVAKQTAERSSSLSPIFFMLQQLVVAT